MTSRSFAGARIETRRLRTGWSRCGRRSFAGARIETSTTHPGSLKESVAPLRERGLKPFFARLTLGCLCRSFAGARIETIG